MRGPTLSRSARVCINDQASVESRARTSGRASVEAAWSMPTQFIEALHRAPGGDAVLVNMLDSLNERLVDRDFLRGFFARCVVEFDADPGADPVRHIRVVSVGLDGGEPLQRRSRAAADDGESLSTLVKWGDWYTYHLDRDKLLSDARDSIPEFPPDNSDQAAVETLLQSVCARPAWWKEGPNEAHLGPPLLHGGNCWVSTSDHDAVLGVEHGGDGTPLQLSCGLGLEYSDNTWLVRYTFRSSDVRDAIGEDVARPSFWDLGNQWFRVLTGSPFGRACAGLQWGTSAHLLSTRESERDGRPERVTLRLPFAKLPSLAVELVGKVASDKALPLLSEEDFLALLLGKRKIDHVMDELRAVLA